MNPHRPPFDNLGEVRIKSSIMLTHVILKKIQKKIDGIYDLYREILKTTGRL
jgi:hypothetical protein